MAGFSTLDWFVIAIYFLLIAALALWVMAGKQSGIIQMGCAVYLLRH